MRCGLPTVQFKGDILRMRTPLAFFLIGKNELNSINLIAALTFLNDCSHVVNIAGSINIVLNVLRIFYFLGKWAISHKIESAVFKADYLLGKSICMLASMFTQ